MALSLKVLRRRLRTVKSTQKITKAMETVSTVKLKRAQERAASARPYANLLKQMISELADDEAAAAHPLAVRKAAKVSRITLVIITADRGLCGAFNANVLKMADRFLAQHAGETVDVAVVGKRAQDYANRRRLNIVERLVPLGGAAKAAASAELARGLMERFVTGQTDEVWILTTRFRSLVRFEPDLEWLLPLELGTEKPAEHHGPRLNYLFEPSAASVLNGVLPRVVESRVHLAIAESAASEHSARRMAMHNATENCKELGTKLTLEINKARQASITKELLEIVGGAEALKG